MSESTQAREARSSLGQRTRIGQGWCIPRPVRRFGDRLMSQQVWCWGRDVECREGNLLVQYGFERHRDRETTDRSTCYRLDQDELHVCLWGFGMFFGSRQQGGLFLNRFDFCPSWAPVESLALDIHWPDELPTFARPRGHSQWLRAKKLWKLSLVWIAEYESWIRKHMGIAYRRQCVESWLQPFVQAEKKAAAWRFLSQQNWVQHSLLLKEQLDQFTVHQNRP